MPISHDEIQRLDAFLDSHIYVNSPDDPLPDMKSVRDVLEKSTHIHNLADSMLLTALLNGPRDTIIMALINGFYWGREFEKTEHLREIFVRKEDRG